MTPSPPLPPLTLTQADIDRMYAELNAGAPSGA